MCARIARLRGGDHGLVHRLPLRQEKDGPIEGVGEMKVRNIVLAVAACALAAVVWVQVVAAAPEVPAPTPPKCYSVDTGETYTTSDPFLQSYFDFVIAEHSGTLYVYEGPDATTITGYTAWPDNDGDYTLPGREAFAQVIDGSDDLVDFIYYPPGDLSYRVDTYVIAAGCAGPPGVPLRNHHGLCYSTFSDDLAFFDVGDIRPLLNVPGSHWWAPSVVKLADGSYKYICNFDASKLKPSGFSVGEDLKTVMADKDLGGGSPEWAEILKSA